MDFFPKSLLRNKQMYILNEMKNSIFIVSIVPLQNQVCEYQNIVFDG